MRTLDGMYVPRERCFTKADNFPKDTAGVQVRHFLARDLQVTGCSRPQPVPTGSGCSKRVSFRERTFRVDERIRPPLTLLKIEDSIVGVFRAHFFDGRIFSAPCRLFRCTQ